jgi:hypothetical protein
MVRNNPIYDNIPGVRDERKRMEAQMRLNQAARPGAGGPYGNDPFDQRARRADQRTVGLPVDEQRDQWEARNNALRAQQSAMAAMEGNPALSAPGLSQDMPSGGSSGGRMAPNEKTQWDPFNNPEMKGMTGMQKRAARNFQPFAEGGPVEGPGGPKDDLINAKLSDGEFVMPAEAVEFYGLDRLTKMMTKAKEGLAEIKPAPQAPRSLQTPQPLPMMMGNPMGQPQSTPGFAYGGPVMRNSLPRYAEGGPKRRYLFDSGDVTNTGMEAVPAAIGAQQFATDMNQNPSFLDYYFPEAGVQASEQASSATQQANDALGRFFDAEAAATAADMQRMAETRQRQDAMMNYQPGSPAPRPAPGPLPVYGSAAPLFPQGRPVAPSPATAMMAPAVSPSPSPQVSPSPSLPLPPAPAMANGRQPQPVVASPMDTPMMRPAPLTMTEKERQARDLISGSRTPQANLEFEAVFAGLTGMQKRRARAGLQMEEATFNRNQARADIEQAKTDERARQERALNFEEWKQKRVIDSQFDMAARNQAIGENAALGAATTAEARAYEETQNRRKQEEQSKRAKNFTPIPDTDYLINDLGNLISKKTNKPVGLSPEEAEKYGLVIIGADSDGRVRYGPPKVTPVERRYIIPGTKDVLTLKPGEVLPEGSAYVPLAPDAAPSPASGAAQPTDAHKALLRSNPSQAAAYDAKFGPGSAARDLK